jgi:hypothetical protein
MPYSPRRSYKKSYKKSRERSREKSMEKSIDKKQTARNTTSPVLRLCIAASSGHQSEYERSCRSKVRNG